jgi:dephospho-CoA kinase
MTPFEPSRAPLAPGPWKHGAIPVIGLTGGIASGKSEVARLLAERGSIIIDADALGHALLEDDAVRDQVVDRFGTGVLTRAAVPAGAAQRIDRKSLGAIVFADPSARRALEAILHPLMRAGFLATIRSAQAAEEARARSIVIDAAILLEAGWDDLCDRVVFVDSPRAERVARAARQRGWSEETFRSREQAQWSSEEKARRADFVVTNEGALGSLEREVERQSAAFAAAPGAAAMSTEPIGSRVPTLCK